jgi:hypothetical protein
VFIGFPNPNHDEENPVAILIACFDESGKLHDQEWVAFSGAVAYEDEWKTMGRLWQHALRDAGVSHVRMTEALSWRGPFDGWHRGAENREEMRDELLVKLAKLALRKITAFVTCPFRTSDFKRLSESDKRKYKDPVYLSFESCARLMHQTTAPSDPIHIYCDESEEYSEQILKMYRRMKREDEDLKKKFCGLTFADEMHYPSLQLADIFAFVQRETKTKGIGARPIVKELATIFNKHIDLKRDFVHEWNGDELGTARTTEVTK